MFPRDEVVRRYLLINTFEGIVVVFAIILSFHFLGIRSPASLLATSVSALLSSALAGTIIVLFVEKAERTKTLADYEHAMLRRLNNTWLEKRMKRAIYEACLAEGVAPMIVGGICVLPIALSCLGALPYDIALELSVGEIAASLFWIGIQLGKVVRRNKVVYGSSLLAVGLAIGFLVYLITAALGG